MIGDWVQDITPVVIDAISNEDICTYRAEYGYITANPSNLKPIPLTAEILEKNGFVEEAFGWRKLNAANWRINIKIFNGKERYALCVLGINSQVTLHGYYVHELQHALKLCGIDKEIVI